jgi:dTMP kinase
VIEGIDRCGKSGQAARLVARLRSRGIPADEAASPDYSSPVGEVISRHLSGDLCLMTGSPGTAFKSRSDPLAFECLQVCDKYVTSARIGRKMAAGTSVVCARWWQSALLYGQDDGIDPNLILDAISSLLRPDLSVLLDVDPARISKRCNRHNRYERDLAKQQRLADLYRELWRKEADGPAAGEHRRGWVVVPGDAGEDEVADRVWREVLVMRPDLVEHAELEDLTAKI